MKKGAAGFTLAETLIGVIIMAVVTASIAFGIRQALAVYGKAAAKSSVLAALRFTSDSYARKIVPMLHTAYKIEVRYDNAVIPAAENLAKDERYLYLDGDAVTLRTQSGDETLPGSEYISKLSFSLPARTDDIDEDYLLTATITASRDVYETVVKSLDIKTALCNKPEKLNTADANGAVLRFFAKDATALALTASMRLKNDYNGEIIDGVTMPNGSKIRMSYTPKLNDSSGEIAKSEYTDNTRESIRWFISASKANDLTESSGDLSSSTENHLFMLVTQSGQPLSSDLLATPADDVYYVLSNGSAIKWTAKEMIIRCRIAPCVTYQEQTVTSSPPYLYSDYVYMQKNVDKGIWRGWLESLKTGTGDDFKRTDVATGNSDKITLAVNNNTIVATIKASAERANVGAATVARLSYKWFENDRVNSIWSLSPKTSADIPPFMTLTNYSVIVDAEMPATGRNGSVAYFWGILLNGTGSSGSAFNDTGYVFQYERKRGYPKQDESQPGLLIRKFEKGELVGYSTNTPKSYGIYNETDNAPGGDQRYLPKNLHNDAFDFYNGKSDDDAWTTRRRVMLTVLEYYTEDKAKPFYIIRAKFLKLTSDYTPEQLAEIKKDDPWCVGKTFFASEPMWFGLYVGNKMTLSGKDSKVDVKHYADSTSMNANVNEAPVTIGRKVIDYTQNLFYGTKYKKDSPGFAAKAVSMREDGGDSYNTRERYIGLRVFSESKGGNNNAAVTFNEVALAPGFSADEIRSIMPQGGRVYEIEDTVPANNAALEWSIINASAWYKGLQASLGGKTYNDVLFGAEKGSDGDGKSSIYYTLVKYENGGNGTQYGGVYDIQHIKTNDCKCPLHYGIYKWIMVVTSDAVINAFVTLLDNTNSIVYKYFNDPSRKNNVNVTLDSTGKNIAPKVLAELEAIVKAADLTNYTWTVERKSPTAPVVYYIYWTNKDVSVLMPGTERIAVDRGRYNTSSKTLTKESGTVTVDSKTVDGKKFNVINTASFMPSFMPK